MNNSETAKSFEVMLTELEVIVRELEDGTISLDDALSRYEKGIGLLRCCFEKLKLAEQRIQQITGTDANGEPVLKPLVETSSLAEAGSSPKKNKRRSVESETE